MSDCLKIDHVTCKSCYLLTSETGIESFQHVARLLFLLVKVSSRNKLVYGRLQDQDIYQICEFINIIYFRERLVVLIGNITSCNETFANRLMYLDNSSIELSLWWSGRIKRAF